MKRLTSSCILTSVNSGHSRFGEALLLHLLFFLSLSISAIAQGDPLTQARVFTDQKEYAKAAELYKRLYEQTPADAAVYEEYLDALLKDKKYKDAEKLAESQIKIRPRDPMSYFSLGKVFAEAGRERKARETFEKTLEFINGDDLLTTRLANAFLTIKQNDFAIKTYERAIEIIKTPYLYNRQLAKLYVQKGETEKAVNTILSIGPMRMPGTEDTQATLLELLENDPDKLQIAQRALIKRINEQPGNSWFEEILTWLYTQKDDWEGALIQMKALDARNQENGRRLIEFARTARKEGAYETAQEALDAVIEKGKGQPVYAIAKAEKLNVMMEALRENPAFKPEQIHALQKEYEAFFEEFPQYYNTESLRDYALLEAQYVHDASKAISLLKKGIDHAGARKDFAGEAKLQLGDYYILDGKIWEASLVYSQVDKDFREDLLGEEARFRNAKLAYYRGDFKWAQAQLSVLKASTSELIANDALYLSVLITENIPPDSNLLPLERFAYADLLLFQNKDAEAGNLLDSISKAFPEHPLKDDILMLRSELALKHREYKKALDYLKEVYEKYDADVLADDAVFKTAEVYEKHLKQPQEAKRFYEQLILKYPGSTYVQTARIKLETLKKNDAALP